jgi:hypothetical protein
MLREGLSAQRLRERLTVPFVQESHERIGWRICEHGTRIFPVDIQGIHGRVSIDLL